MKSFMSADAAWLHTMETIFRFGSHTASRAGGRSDKTMEMLGYGIKLEDIRSNLVSWKPRKISRAYAIAELMWYLLGSNDVRFLAPFAPSYSNFAEELTHTAAGAYGHRWKHNPGHVDATAMTRKEGQSQLTTALELLMMHGETRQCVMTMWDSMDLAEAAYGPKRRDVPCTVCMQFFVRGSFLHAHVHMRSNDAYIGLPYDMFCFSSIQRLMADALGLQYGTYTHTVGSMHLYEKDWSKAHDIFTRRLPAPDWRETAPGTTVDIGFANVILRSGGCVRMKNFHEHLVNGAEMSNTAEGWYPDWLSILLDELIASERFNK